MFKQFSQHHKIHDYKALALKHSVMLSLPGKPVSGIWIDEKYTPEEELRFFKIN